ncbi:MAG TPA: hypothetical protein IAC04_04760 [Candidatus Coprenecus stercoravium]|uniref:Uncharacterized protein n=1 Tax=Candidatus Coprenecus stercoravium TaxID=2840735 RepID=A0A9D2GPD5_9BACT|nr:hypothetical protein [Candidatus Coprenecus stercoravium]
MHLLLTPPHSANTSLGVVIGEEPEITVTVGGEPVDAGTVQTFYAGATRDFNYSINYEVTELTFTYPEGWSVSAEEGVITVVSPVDAASGAASGVITATATDGEWTLTVDILSVEAKFPVEPTTAPEVGDYVYEDGTWGKETTSAIGARAIAVVFYNSNPQEFGDAELVKDHPEATHGLAVAINSAAQETRWTNINTFSWILDNITITNTLIAGDGLSADQNPLLGYSNNKVMRLFNEANPEKTQFNAVTLADEYNVSYPAPARTSGWYVPSVSEFIRLCDNTLTDITVILKSDDEEPVVVPYPTAEAVNGKLSALDGAEALSGRYFLSNRQNTSNGYIIVLDDEDGVSSVRGTSSSVADMRFILAF